MGMSNAEVIEWYSETADMVAQLDGDGETSQSRYIRSELESARAEMQARGLSAATPRRFGRS